MFGRYLIGGKVSTPAFNHTSGATFLLEGGNYAISVPNGTWTATIGSNVTSTTYPDASSGNPNFVRANSDTLANAVDINTYVGTTANLYSGDAIVEVDDIISTATVSSGDGEMIVGDDGGYIGLVLRKSGLNYFATSFQYDPPYKTASVSIPASGRMHLQFRANGTNIQIRLDGGTWQTGDAATLGLTASATQLRLGRSWTGTYFDGRMKYIRLTNVCYSDSVADQLVAYGLTNYP